MLRPRSACESPFTYKLFSRLWPLRRHSFTAMQVCPCYVRFARLASASFRGYVRTVSTVLTPLRSSPSRALEPTYVRVSRCTCSSERALRLFHFVSMRASVSVENFVRSGARGDFAYVALRTYFWGSLRSKIRRYVCCTLQKFIRCRSFFV